MKKRMIVVLVVLLLAIGFFMFFIYPLPSYVPSINEDFQKALVGCDKIIIRDGGCDPSLKCYTNKALKIIDDPCEVRNFINAIHFSVFQGKGMCACYGWPGVDFYNGDKLIIVTSVQHNIALRTPIQDYDIRFSHDTQMFFERLTSDMTRGIVKIDPTDNETPSLNIEIPKQNIEVPKLD